MVNSKILIPLRDDEEDHSVIKVFDSGKMTKQLAEKHQRTE
jgi:hypothetical protein